MEQNGVCRRVLIEGQLVGFEMLLWTEGKETVGITLSKRMENVFALPYVKALALKIVND